MPFTRRASLALLATAAAAAAAPSIAATKPKDKSKPASGGEKSFTYTLPGESVYPEGISLDEARRRYFVSSTTDGTIFSGSVRSRAAEVFLPGGTDGRTTAVGVRVDDGRLWVAGGPTGAIFVYDTDTKALIRRFDTGTGGFLNDIAITPSGDAYVTDSQRPVLHRIGVEALGDPSVAPETIPVPAYGASGFGANGIVAIDDETLVYVQSNTGRLYRVDLPTRTVQAIDLRGAELTNGDGLVLRNRTLYVVRNRQQRIVEVRLRRDLESGRVVSETGDPTFRYPTTAALARGGRLLVVNSQFDKRSAGQPPELPFTVSSVKRR